MRYAPALPAEGFLNQGFRPKLRAVRVWCGCVCGKGRDRGTHGCSTTDRVQLLPHQRKQLFSGQHKACQPRVRTLFANSQVFAYMTFFGGPAEHHIIILQQVLLGGRNQLHIACCHDHPSAIPRAHARKCVVCTPGTATHTRSRQRYRWAGGRWAANNRAKAANFQSGYCMCGMCCRC